MPRKKTSPERVQSEPQAAEEVQVSPEPGDAAKPSPRLSPEHKEALGFGRDQSVVVRRYLKALQMSRHKPGRRRSLSSVERDLSGVEAKLRGANPLARLGLLQQRRDLLVERDRMTAEPSITEAEAGFIGVAAGYGIRKGIDYASWREIGVPADVLARAGIDRTARHR